MTSQHHLAQINIGRTVAPLDSPALADFMNGLAEINALAEASPGFVWRLQTPAGDATSLKPYPDERIIINLTVWETLEHLKDFAYKSQHALYLKRRGEWFEKFDGPFIALWWVKAGEIPTIAEAQERLEYLRTHGETPYAFSFRKTFQPEALVVSTTVDGQSASSAAH